MLHLKLSECRGNEITWIGCLHCAESRQRVQQTNLETQSYRRRFALGRSSPQVALEIAQSGTANGQRLEAIAMWL